MPDCMKHIRPGRFCYQCEDEWQTEFKELRREAKELIKCIERKEEKIRIARECNMVLEDENFKLRDIVAELKEELSLAAGRE